MDSPETQSFDDLKLETPPGEFEITPLDKFNSVVEAHISQREQRTDNYNNQSDVDIYLSAKEMIDAGDVYSAESAIMNHLFDDRVSLTARNSLLKLLSDARIHESDNLNKDSIKFSSKSDFDEKEKKDSQLYLDDATRGIYPPEQWKGDIKRVLRRDAIRRYMGISRSVEDIIYYVRKFEEEEGVDTVIEELSEQDILVDPGMEEMAYDLQRELIRKYPWVNAVVLLGSSAHGGAKIRRITRSGRPDLDWGVITDGKVTRSDVSDMTIESESAVKYLAKEYGLSSEFHSCRVMNPERFNTPSLETSDDVLRMIEENDIRIVLYFQPSVPTTENDNNRQIIINTLNELKISDPEEWERAISYIVINWQKIHKLKEKHFNSTKNVRDTQLLHKVVENSSQVMSRPLVKTLIGSK